MQYCLGILYVEMSNASAMNLSGVPSNLNHILKWRNQPQTFIAILDVPVEILHFVFLFLFFKLKCPIHLSINFYFVRHYFLEVNIEILC